MKWVLAGISFAILVALAIGTAAVKAENIRLRARIERTSRDVDACRLELARRSLADGLTPELMAMLWRQIQEQALADGG